MQRSLTRFPLIRKKPKSGIKVYGGFVGAVHHKMKFFDSGSSRSVHEFRHHQLAPPLTCARFNYRDPQPRDSFFDLDMPIPDHLFFHL
jgi:hypothetical protein